MSAAERSAEIALPGPTDEVVVPWRFIHEVRIALTSATTIGLRSCKPGDGLNYGNHDRLIAEADDLLGPEFRRLRAFIEQSTSPGQADS